MADSPDPDSSSDITVSELRIDQAEELAELKVAHELEVEEL